MTTPIALALLLGADISPTGPTVLRHLIAASGARRWADDSRLGRPFSKDPSVIRCGGRYLMYFSIPPSADPAGPRGLNIGIAASRDLLTWEKVGEILPAQECDAKGLGAPCAKVLDGRVHLFYQSYGNGPLDAICHAVSSDGLTFERDPSNPVFRPSGDWTCGRAIDADVVEWRDRLLLLCATRDPEMKEQMLVAATADRHSGFGRGAWTQLGDGPALRPELPWETRCIEAPALTVRGDRLFVFYAGGYNNDPQVIGVASSTDAVHWQRVFDQPLFPQGEPGEWNSSETGHPGFLVDDDGTNYLFFQGNNDHGRTWYLSWVKVGWAGEVPYLIDE